MNVGGEVLFRHQAPETVGATAGPAIRAPMIPRQPWRILTAMDASGLSRQAAGPLFHAMYTLPVFGVPPCHPAAFREKSLARWRG